MSLITLIDFSELGDERGQLVAIEGSRNIPFDILRVYYMTRLKRDLARGFHAHRQLQQIAICLHGSCRFVLDNGCSREEIVLERPAQGLLIGNMIWREMHDFSDDCVLMVLANEYYDEEDYIRSYSTFLEAVQHA